MSASAAVDASAPEAQQVPAEETTKEVEAEIATEPAAVADAVVAEEEVSDMSTQHENTTIIILMGPAALPSSLVARGERALDGYPYAVDCPTHLPPLSLLAG